jgi:hypothetical protein
MLFWSMNWINRILWLFYVNINIQKMKELNYFAIFISFQIE